MLLSTPFNVFNRRQIYATSVIRCVMYGQKNLSMFLKLYVNIYMDVDKFINQL